MQYEAKKNNNPYIYILLKPSMKSSGKLLTYWISYFHLADAIYHLIDSEYGNQSDCGICDR